MENQARQAADERRQKQIRDEKFQRIYQSVEHAQAVLRVKIRPVDVS